MIDALRMRQVRAISFPEPIVGVKTTPSSSVSKRRGSIIVLPEPKISKESLRSRSIFVAPSRHLGWRSDREWAPSNVSFFWGRVVRIRVSRGSGENPFCTVNGQIHIDYLLERASTYEVVILKRRRGKDE